MTRIQVEAGDMRAAADSVRDAAAGAGARGGEHIGAAAAAVPGSTAEGLLTSMGPAWQSELESWQDAAESFAEQVAATGERMTTTDAGQGSLLGGLTGMFGGG